jgi:O-methyltransferase involved in polyketide biosynthesis
VTDSLPPAENGQQRQVDTRVPHSARIWNYWLGGKDNFAIDRQVGDQVLQIFPDIGYLARSVRSFLERVVTYLAREAGIRQFLDIGTGLPTFRNTHEVAQAIAPESRIVYVDNDPLVLAHARALLTSTPEGRTDYIDADARDSETILRAAGRTLDLTQPVAITMLGILGHILDDDEAYATVDRLLKAVPSGSYFAITDPTHSESMDALLEHWNRFGEPKMTARSPEQLARFLDGLEIVEPGMVPVTQWHPELAETQLEGGARPEADPLGAVGRKP